MLICQDKRITFSKFPGLSNLTGIMKLAKSSHQMLHEVLEAHPLELSTHMGAFGPYTSVFPPCTPSSSWPTSQTLQTAELSSTLVPLPLPSTPIERKNGTAWVNNFVNDRKFIITLLCEVFLLDGFFPLDEKVSLAARLFSFPDIYLVTLHKKFSHVKSLLEYSGLSTCHWDFCPIFNYFHSTTTCTEEEVAL